MRNPVAFRNPVALRNPISAPHPLALRTNAQVRKCGECANAQNATATAKASRPRYSIHTKHSFIHRFIDSNEPPPYHNSSNPPHIIRSIKPLSLGTRRRITNMENPYVRIQIRTGWCIMDDETPCMDNRSHLLPHTFEMLGR